VKEIIDKSVRWYIDFMNSIPIAVYRSTIEGTLEYCNLAFARIFGFETIGDLIGYPVIKLYRNKKDRGALIHSIIQRRRVTDIPIAFVKQDGTPIWCAVSARAVMDDDGIVVHLDGQIHDITDEIEEKGEIPSLGGIVRPKDDIIIIFDMRGNILDINEIGIERLGYTSGDLRNKPLVEFLIPRQKDLFLLFLSDTLRFGSEQMVLSLMDSSGKAHHFDCHTILVKKDDRAHHIKCIGRDITNRMPRQKANSNKEKMQGVLEMAGAVVHHMNQPLTVVNCLLNEIMADIPSTNSSYEKILKMQTQIIKMNDITKKIGKIKKYAAMDYLAGVKIVDIDKAS